MGVTEKLKRLHKQTLLKLKDIKRVLIADEAGVNNEEYLNRARTLDNYINPKEPESHEQNAEQANQVEKSSELSDIKKNQGIQTKSSSKKSAGKTTFKM